MQVKQASYVDEAGRKWVVWLEDDMADSEACMGLPIGPPSLEHLRLPLAVEVRLHNQLYDRGILTLADAQRRPQDIFASIQAALKVDVSTIQAAFA